MTLTPLPASTRRAYAMTAGPDGQVWFTEQQGSIFQGGAHFFVGSINPTTLAISEHPVGYATGGITTGPDGNLWFDGPGALGNINPTTLVTSTFPSPSSTIRMDPRS